MLFLKKYFKRLLLFGGETWKRNKKRGWLNSRHGNEMTKRKNKPRMNWIRYSNIRYELGVDEMKDVIQKSKFRWFGHVVRMTEERIPKKMLLPSCILST